MFSIQYLGFACAAGDALDIAAPGTHHGTPKGPGLSAKDPPAAYFDWSDHGALKSRFVKLFFLRDSL